MRLPTRAFSDQLSLTRVTGRFLTFFFPFFVADCLCRLWDLNEGQVRSEFKLESPGVSVRWHPQDPMKVGGKERGRRRERGKGLRREEGEGKSQW